MVVRKPTLEVAMSRFLLCILSLLICTSLVNADENKPTPEAIQKKLDEVKQAELNIQKEPTLPEEEPQSNTKSAEEEAILKIRPTETNPKPCVGLSVEELSFAHSLDPVRRKAFCTQFSAEQRMIAMNMVGKSDSEGNLLTPESAFDVVAEQHDIHIPNVPGEDLNKEPETSTTP